MAKKKVSAEEKEKAEAIKKYQEKLGLTSEEAEEMWAFDHDEIECEEAEALDEKAKAVTKEKKKGSSLDKVRNMKAKKKKDAAKEAIIQMVFNAVKGSDLTLFAQEMTGTKMSFMDTLGGFYSVTITKHKAQPDGFKGAEI